MKMKTIDLIYKEGRDAFDDFLLHEDNPYEEGSPEFEAWDDGWWDREFEENEYDPHDYHYN